MSQADLLIEIACEELPARFVRKLANALRDGLCAGLKEQGIAFGDAQALGTPRRIAALIRNVAEQQAEQSMERRGPAVLAAYKDGEPTKAAQGFAQGCGVSVAELTTISTDKGEYLYFSRTAPGLATNELLQGIFDSALKRMDGIVPKRMRWGDGDVSFVRPVHGLVALHGSAIVPLKALNHRADNQTSGHRFHHDGMVTIEHASNYVAAMQQAHVLVDMDARKQRVREQVEEISQGKALIADDLLEEVSALVEWPQPILGRFDEEFLQLPDEVIVTTIQDHQRYFPVYGDDGRISPQFVTVANISSRDASQVTQGNEKVVRPRLQDALFFWQQDLKASPEDWLNKLKQVTYIKGLGSLADKTRRMRGLAGLLAVDFAVDADAAEQASSLSKADLASHAVYEMPELQGIMGGHYARQRGLPEDICLAISQHYQPAGPDDAVPDSALAALTALADKLDSLICLFSQVELRPSSSKDPYGARRAALGVIRILATHKLHIPLASLLSRASELCALHQLDSDSHEALLKFFADRHRVWLTSQGFDARIVEAVMSIDHDIDVYDSLLRCQALQDMQDDAAFEQLAAANKRIRNILADAGRLKLDAAALQERSEHALHAALEQGAKSFSGQLQQRDYVAAMHSLAALSLPITTFFEDVLVNAEDDALKNARHALLQIFAQRCNALADFTALSKG
ncbi:MAG: glycine--tRNA ligase subunit beta [Oceanococcus sp.]